MFGGHGVTKEEAERVAKIRYSIWIQETHDSKVFFSGIVKRPLMETGILTFIDSDGKQHEFGSYSNYHIFEE